MRVFISWSGDLSHEVAEAIRTWLPMMLQFVKPYLSSEDMYAGMRWHDSVAKELEASNYGIFCVSRDNVSNPWLNFEAGALSKSVSKSRVSPLLINAKPAEITGPLMQFQATTYGYSGMMRLVKSINSLADAPLQDALLERQFKYLWEDLDKPVQRAVRKDDANGKSVEPVRGIEDMVSELLTLARNQNMTFSNFISKPGSSPSVNAKIKVFRDVDFAEVRYHLKRIRAIADKMVVPGSPETPSMVQLRALIDVMTDCLAPIFNTE
jgi:hypothetical protein